MNEIICDNKKLVYTNRICCISNESISLKIDFSDTDFLNLVFNFLNDGNEVKTHLRSPENAKVVFDLYNYNNPLGTGVTTPVEVGTLHNKKIFLIFYVYRLDKSTFPILDLSLYMEV